MVMETSNYGIVQERASTETSEGACVCDGVLGVHRMDGLPFFFRVKRGERGRGIGVGVGGDEFRSV